MREAARGTTDGDFLRRAAMNPSRNFFVPSSDGQPCSLLAANNHPAELATNATKVTRQSQQHIPSRGFQEGRGAQK